MNSNSSRLFATVCMTAPLCVSSVARAQGALTPPGSPAPTMKTLAQVEPRTPISGAPVTLERAGSYYLTADLEGTVTIASDNVSLDLRGFTITPREGDNAITVISGTGKNLCVHNGVLFLPGSDGVGISTSGSGGGSNGRVESLRVSGGRYGILVGSGYTVRDCQVTGADTGIRVGGNSVVRKCRLEANVTGLRLSGTGAFVEENIIRGNTNNFIFAAGNRLSLLLCEIPQSLDWPCSVKLAGTLSTTQPAVNGISVNANDVTIDLAGHALIGAGGSSGHGIYQGSEYRNLKISNGKISNWCGANKGGVFISGESALLSDLQATTNAIGCYLSSASVAVSCVAVRNATSGFYVGSRCSLSKCTSSYNLDCGMFVSEGCEITECTVSGNVREGIFSYANCLISACMAWNNWKGIVSVNGYNSISACTAINNSVHGIEAGDESVISRCVADWNGVNGIRTDDDCLVSESSATANDEEGICMMGSGSVSACQADDNGQVGIKVADQGNVVECSAVGNSNHGLMAGNGSRFSNCLSCNNAGVGLYVSDDSAVLDCVADYNTLDGIRIAGNCAVSRCVAMENGKSGDGAGIHATGMGNRIEGNHAVGNDRGFDIDQGGNFIVRNTSRWNSPNWEVASGNICLVVLATAGGAISGDSGGASLGSTDPNANFTY